MNKQRKTSHILNVFQYDADGHVVLPASLALGIAPTGEDNSGKVPTTAWVRSIVGGAVTAYAPTSRTITINGTSYDLSSNRAWSIDTGVMTASAGLGISVSVVNQNLNIVNTGILTASSGAGISLSVVNQNLNVVNTGILTASAGLGISLSVVNQNLNVINTGILTASAGSGISLSVVDQNLNVINTGVLTASAGAGISLSIVGGNLNVVNTITNNNQLTNGAGYITSSALTGYATETYVGIAISNLVDAAPGTLDTLNELAAALGDDPNFATTVSTSIGTKVPQTRTITINGTSYDLTANRSWTINSMVYPSAGIALSTGTAWGTSITDNSTNWNTAYGWGNHASGGYLTGITSTQVTNALGYTPYNSTNPSGYITSSALSSYLPLTGGTMSGQLYAPSIGTGVYEGAIQIRETSYVGSNQSAWGYAPAITFHWGNRTVKKFGIRADGLFAVDDEPLALRSWVTSQGYITSYTETDTLNSVTGRGNTTSNSVRFGSHADISPTNSAFRFYDGTTFRGGFGTELWGHSGSDANLVLYVNGDNTLFFSTSGTKRASLSSSAFNSLVALQQSGNQVLHAGNYSSYALPLSGGTVTGTVTINGGAAHPLAISSGQRYQLQIRNTNNSINSGYGWWWFTDTNFNMGFHADGASDRFTLTRDGNLSVSGTIAAANFSGSSSGTNTGDQTNISGNAATVSSITGNTGLMVNRLTPTSFIDSMTASTFRSYVFGTSANGAALSATRWNNVPPGLSGMNSYGTLIGWSGDSDTHGFIATDYSTANAQIGGGYGNNISWKATLLHSSNYSSYALPLSGGTMTGDITMSGSGRGIYFTGGNNRIYFAGNRAIEGNGTNLQIGEGHSQTQIQSAITQIDGNLYIANNGGRLYFDRLNGATVGAVGWHSNDVFYVAGHPDYGPGAGNHTRMYGFGGNLYLGNATNGDVVTIDGTSGNITMSKLTYFYAGLRLPDLDGGVDSMWGIYGWGTQLQFTKRGLSGDGYGGTAMYIDYDGLYVQSDYSFRSPQFRFTNSGNSAYMTGDAGWGARIQTDSGYILFGPANGSYAHIYTDRGQFYFNKDILINGTQVVVNSGTWGIAITGSAGTAGSVTHNASRTDGTWYNVGWFAGSQSPAYSADSVQIRSSDGSLRANYFSSAYYMDVYTTAGADYLRLTDNQVYRPNGGILYLNWSSNANVALTGPGGGKVGVGNNSPSYKMHVSGDIYANGGWLRVSGDSGLYFESYGGGWRMTGSSYIESYGSKSLHMQGASVDYVGSLYFSGAGHIQPNAGSYGALQMTSSKNGWAGIRFTEYNTNLMSNATTSGFHHNDYGWQFKWESGNAYVYSGTYGGGSAYTVIHSSNISSQSVNYASSSGSAGTITGRSRGSFTVGGSTSTYYPVAFQIGSGATGEQGISVLQIERGGYDEPGYSSTGFGTFHCRIRAKADGWGYGASYVQVEANAYTIPMLAEISQQNQTSQLIVWLRGGQSYRWYDVEGGWSLNFSNGSGTNYSTFNGNAVYSPTTTNTIGSNFKYQQGWGNNYISGRLTAGGGVTSQSQLICALHSSATPDYSNPLWIWANPDNDAIVIQNTTAGGTPPKIYFRDTNGTIQTSNTLIRLRTSNSDSLSAWLNGSTWNVTGDVVAYASDKRLKENIKTIPNAIKKINSLSGVTFDWNTVSEEAGFVPKRKHNEVGVLAQDVQNVLPQAVEYAPFDRNDDGTSRSGEDYLTVKYEKIVPLLIEAIKEQQKQIEELQNKLDNVLSSR